MDTFKIRKLTLIIEIEKNNYNTNCKQFIKDFIYKKLETIIEQCIGTFKINEKIVLYIENTLKIELGQFKIEKNQYLFYKNFQREFSTEFQKKIQNIINSNSHTIIPINIYQKNIFTDYLKTGYLTDEYTKEDINELYIKILKNSEEDIKDIFLTITKNSQIIDSFLNTIKQNLIYKTIKILYKKNYQEIKKITEDFIKIKKIICNDFFSEDFVKKKINNLLLLKYGEQNFDVKDFIIDLIKEINKSHKEKYEKIIYTSFFKIQNTNKINRHIFKSNLIKITIENLYKENFENIEKQSFYNINDNLQTLDLAISEININNSKKFLQKLLTEIDYFFSLQYFNKEKIKIILNNKIKNINFQDCDLSVLVNIFCPHLSQSYLLIRDIFPSQNIENNILTIKFFNKKNDNIVDYICANIENSCKNNNDIFFFEKTKKNISQKKKEINCQEIDILHTNFIQIYKSQNSLKTIKTTSIANFEEKLLLSHQLKQLSIQTSSKKNNYIVEENKQNTNIETKKTIETEKNKEKTKEKKPDISLYNRTFITKEEQNIQKKDNKKIGNTKNKKKNIQTIIPLIKKKNIGQKLRETLNFEQKKEIIAQIVKTEKKTINDLINIFLQVNINKNKKTIQITDLFFDSFKYKIELDFSINFIINQFILSKTITKKQIFYELKNIIKKKNNKAALLLKKNIKTNEFIFNDSHKNKLHEILLISEYNDIYKKNNLLNTETALFLNKYFIEKINQPINEINIELIQKKIPNVKNIFLKKNIINIFVKNYIRKIKNNFSEIMSTLYLERFNYIDEYYINEIISFFTQITKANTKNEKIDNFLSYCKKEFIKTLSKPTIINKIKKQQLKNIFKLLPTIKEKIKKKDLDNNNKPQKSQNNFNKIINDIKNRKELIIERLNKFNNQEIFSFLEYTYFELLQKNLLKDIFTNEIQKKYKTINLIFNKLLQNKNINSKKIKIIIDYFFIKNYNKNNIFIYKDIFNIIDLTNIIYGINLVKYFYDFQSNFSTFYKNLNINNFDKIINLYIDKITSLLKNKNENNQNISDIQQIEILITSSLSYSLIKNIQTNKIEKKTEEKKILREEKIENICREENIKKIYIRNGGLVFMWPFFYDFFEKQNLLDKYNKTIFKNNISKNNAIHALEFLVSESYKNPDWKLSLNKILCGFNIKETIFNEYIFNERTIKKKNDKQNITTEKKNIRILKNNAEKIIKKCIDRWEGLKSLIIFDEFKKGINVKNFRNYFLQRESFLNIIEQKYDNGVKYSYILDISNKCYDEYIKNIPWNVQRIQLPSMQQPIIIRNLNIPHEDDNQDNFIKH